MSKSIWGLFTDANNDESSIETRCDWCGSSYTAQQKKEMGGILCAKFGNKIICNCCFREVEYALLQSMPQIIPWFIEIIKAREQKTTQMKKLIEELKDTLSK